MKYGLWVILLSLAIAAVAGCSKRSGPASDGIAFISVLGKWDLVKDSTLSGAGLYASYTIRTGTFDDHWDFRTDGRVYIKEGDFKDTAGYTLYPGNQIAIERFGWIFNGVQTRSTIKVLTAHQLVIHSADIMPPGGVNVRTVYLKR